MSRLDDAMTSFSRSLDRLESSLQAKGPNAHLPPSAIPGEVKIELDKLRAEKVMMVRELETVRAENERLASLTSDVSHQIDATLAEVKSVLERSH